jgi:hypothetical protein
MKYDPKQFDAMLEKHVDLAAAAKRAPDSTVYYHGSPSGKLVGKGGIHIGTLEAAREALNARIGVKADGTDWNGVSVYGKTKIAGRMRCEWIEKTTKHFVLTGYNARPPVEDYYPTDTKADTAKYSDGSRVDMSSKPTIFHVRIIGPMKNTRSKPTTDNFVNSKRRSMDFGYYYSNIGEDAGSISVVVPSADWLKVL